MILLVFYSFRVFGFQVYQIIGNSMHPTLPNGSFVLVTKWGYPAHFNPFSTTWTYSEERPKKLDIVIFEDEEGELLVKRVIGLPGEFYEFQFGMVLIDSHPLQEDYLPRPQVTTAPDMNSNQNILDSAYIPMQPKGRIPPNYFLLLGDNREYSTDSRTLGLIRHDKLLGKVHSIF
jgi:signal peptidase I